MFIGHWAPAFVAAGANPKSQTLAMLFVAAQLLDWAFFAFLLGGIEHMRFSTGISVMNPMDLYHMPYTHSLAGALAFGGGTTVVIWTIQRESKVALTAGAVVVSHWLLDLLVHVPDLTITGQAPKLGLGLWNHPHVEMPLELSLTFAALWFYARRCHPSAIRLGVLAAVLLVLQAVNWFGPDAAQVDRTTSFIAFFAFGVATLAAWWTDRSVRPA